MPGHTMLYLGQSGGKAYMIHAFTQYGEKQGSSIKAVDVYQVAVTPVDILTTGGVPFIQKFTTLLQF